MARFDIQTLESDLHRLDLRFACLRLQQPRMVDRLARSIEQSGQLVPVVAVAEPQRWVLIDGYLRIEALHRLSRDTARVELWDCPLSQALLCVLVRAQGRPWEAIEEGAMVRELMTRFGLSQREVARQTGRDVSWVNRRLSLVQELPEALFIAICQGELSTWAATRILAPLARANNAHAQDAAHRPAARPVVHPRVDDLVPTLSEGQPPETATHAGPAPSVLSGPAGADPGAGGRRVACGTGRGLAGGVETHPSPFAWTAPAGAIGLCGGPGNGAATAGLGGDENPCSGFRRDIGEVYPS